MTDRFFTAAVSEAHERIDQARSKIPDTDRLVADIDAMLAAAHDAVDRIANRTNER